MVPAVLMVVAAAGAAVVLVSGIGITGGKAGKPQSKINGTYTVTEQAGFEAARSCETATAKDGTPVTVSDGAGKALGVGRLFDGTGIKVAGDKDKASQCRFGFTVLRLPAVESYVVQVGAGEPRSVTRADLISNHWRFDIS